MVSPRAPVGYATWCPLLRGGGATIRGLPIRCRGTWEASLRRSCALRVGRIRVARERRVEVVDAFERIHRQLHDLWVPRPEDVLEERRQRAAFDVELLPPYRPAARGALDHEGIARAVGPCWKRWDDHVRDRSFAPSHV